MTKIERALTALYSGRCNLVKACEIAEINQDTMKRLLLDKVRSSQSHPIQLTLPLS